MIVPDFSSRTSCYLRDHSPWSRSNKHLCQQSNFFSNKTPCPVIIFTTDESVVVEWERFTQLLSTEGSHWGKPLEKPLFYQTPHFAARTTKVQKGEVTFLKSPAVGRACSKTTSPHDDVSLQFSKSFGAHLYFQYDSSLKALNATSLCLRVSKASEWEGRHPAGCLSTL